MEAVEGSMREMGMMVKQVLTEMKKTEKPTTQQSRQSQNRRGVSSSKFVRAERNRARNTPKNK